MIRFDGIPDVLSALDRYRRAPEGAATAAERVAEVVRRNMIENHLTGEDLHIQSGALSNYANWPLRRYTTPGPGCTLSTWLVYAPIHNYGIAGRYVARRFLNAAMDESQPLFKQAMLEGWREELGS